MAHVRTVLWLLVVLLVMPAVACGSFLRVCDCKRITHTAVTHCSHCEHEHDVPKEHNCLHEDYQIQAVKTQVPVPVYPVCQAEAAELPAVLRFARCDDVWVRSRLCMSRRWGPPDVLGLPLLI